MLAVSSATSCWANAPSKSTVWLPVLIALPVTLMSWSAMLLSASSAAWVCAAVALNGIGAVVWPLKVSVKVPPVALLTRTVWVSDVFMSLCGEKPPELPPPAGVSSPVTNQRLLCLSKSMSPATWQHAPRLLATWRIFCSDARSSVGFSPSTNLKRESWK